MWSLEEIKDLDVFFWKIASFSKVNVDGALIIG